MLVHACVRLCAPVCACVRLCACVQAIAKAHIIENGQEDYVVCEKQVWACSLLLDTCRRRYTQTQLNTQTQTHTHTPAHALQVMQALHTPFCAPLYRTFKDERCLYMLSEV